MHTQGMAHPQDGVKARLRPRLERVVQVLPAQATVGRQLRHAAGPRHMAQGPQDFVGVAIGKHLGQVLK